MEQAAIRPKTPWLTILYKPRETMRQILTQPPLYGVWWIFAAIILSGIPSSLISPPQPGEPPVVIMTLAFAVIFFFSIVLAVGVTKIMGKFLGGDAALRQNISANIWPILPQVYANILVIPVIYYYDVMHPINWVIWGVGYLYYCILLAVCLSETLKISLKKAWAIVGAQVIALIGLLLIIIVIAVIVSFIYGMFTYSEID